MPIAIRSGGLGISAGASPTMSSTRRGGMPSKAERVLACSSIWASKMGICASVACSRVADCAGSTSVTAPSRARRVAMSKLFRCSSAFRRATPSSSWAVRIPM